MEQNKFYHNLSICKAESKSTFDSKVETVMAKACYDYMDVVLADFGEIQNDCLIHKVRPAIVISSTGYNTNSPVMQVIPMTKKMKNIDSSYHVFIDMKDCENLNNSGVAMVEQLCTIDRAHVVHWIGTIVDERLIEKIQTAVKQQLGLEGC